MGKKCEKCGAELKEDARFCTSCGAPVIDESEQEIEKKQVNISKKKIVIVIATVVVIGGGIAICTKMLSKPKSTEQTVKTESAQNSEKTSETSKITEEEEKVPSYRYQWTVKPEIEADQIYYTTAAYGSYNDYHKQSMNAYAIIEKDGLKGLIDSYGVLRTAIQYENIIAIEEDTYLLRDQNGNEYELLTYGEDKLVLHEKESEDFKDDGSSGTDGLTENTDWSGFYCYKWKLRNAHLEYDGDVSPGIIPVQQSTEELWSLSDWNNLEGKYALYSQGNICTDFIYDACGSKGDCDLLAVSKDGKWGYVSGASEVIPIQYDATWNRYTSNEIDAENIEASAGTDEFCYAPANGYIPLRQGEKWELEDYDGKVIISFGEFEEILPVNSYKRCWVKKDGKWGAIKITDEEVQSNENTEWKQRAIDWAKRKYSEDNGRTFLLVDMNGDHIPEVAALKNEANTESRGSLGTFASEETREMDLSDTVYYKPDGNVIDYKNSDGEKNTDEIYAVYNGQWRSLGSGSYNEDNYEWYDEQNGYQEVSREEYEEKINSLIDVNSAELLEQKGVTIKEIIQQIQDYE